MSIPPIAGEQTPALLTHRDLAAHMAHMAHLAHLAHLADLAHRASTAQPRAGEYRAHVAKPERTESVTCSRVKLGKNVHAHGRH